MKLLGFNHLKESLPPKIWRAIMLDRYGLPTTDYLIINLQRVAPELTVQHLCNKLLTSQCGIVVRTVSWKDGKKQPYHWLQRGDEEMICNLVKVLKNQYIMAFTPLALPGQASGFTVGRYAILDDDTRIIEYVQDEIEPRILERLSAVQLEKGRSGILTKKPGRLFRVSTPTNLAAAILRVIRQFEDHIYLLKDAIADTNHPGRGREVCLEFTLNYLTGNMEFHDFDQ